MSSVNLPGRRRRKPTFKYQASPSSTAEEQVLQKTLSDSTVDINMPTNDKALDIPFGPTFFPTVEEFEKPPLHYINKIRPIAEKYGICKIKPPNGWKPPFSIDLDSKKTFETKEQLLHRLQEGISFGDGKEYSATDYMEMAFEQTRKYKKSNFQETTSQCVDDFKNASSENRMTPENIEKMYWNIIESRAGKYSVEYGNDIDSQEFGSGFPLSERGRSIGRLSDDRKLDLPEPKFGTDEFYKETYWNLNNIARCPGSALSHIKVDINGVNVPWVYFGTLFSTFCWHNEDNYLYSISYNHWGAPKQWYGVPGQKKYAEGVERVFKKYFSTTMRDVPDLLHHITTMLSPAILQKEDIPVCKLLQHSGEFVVTFPRAFHGGFSLGPNIGEAVNFALEDWITRSAEASECYRLLSRPAVFSHDRLVFTMANHIREQTNYETCKLLSQELKRVIEEEIHFRKLLLDSGVRDVSSRIELPRNQIDEFNEKDADYDDKRMCYACKYICFFSCVACRCSESKVSCMRHSHFMCRCQPSQRYMMIWSNEKEMKGMLDDVESRAEALRSKCGTADDFPSDDKDVEKLLPHAPGSVEDLGNRKDYEIILNRDSPIIQCFTQTPKEFRKLPDSHFAANSKKIKIEVVPIATL